MTTNIDPPRRDGAGDSLGDYDDIHGDPAADARRRLALPALLLMIGAAVTMLPFLALAVWGVWMLFRLLLAADPPNAGRAQQAEEVGPIFTGLGVVGTAYLAVVLAGAVRMKQFRRYRFARAAAILGIISVVFLQAASVFVLPCAIWALVVLRDPAVKSQFRPSGNMVKDNDA